MTKTIAVMPTKTEISSFAEKLRGDGYADYPGTLNTWLARDERGLYLCNTLSPFSSTTIICSVPNGLPATCLARGFPGVAEWLLAGMPDLD